MNTNEPRKGEYPVPANARLARCRSCNAEVIWTTTANKRPIPLSVATIRVDEQGHKFALSHFADCPNAKGHRKPVAASSVVPDPTNVTPSDMTVDMRDYEETMRHRGLVATSSGIDRAGRVTVTTRRDTAQAIRDADNREMCKGNLSRFERGWGGIDCVFAVHTELGRKEISSDEHLSNTIEIRAVSFRVAWT